MTNNDYHLPMEAYESQTREVVNHFLHYGLSFPDCISALDAALADLVPRLSDGQLPALRAVMLANNARVMSEMERRGIPEALDVVHNSGLLA
jgi:hypothetical protein